MPLLSSHSPILVSVGQIHPTRVELEPNESRSGLRNTMELGKDKIYPKEMPVTVLGDAIAMADVAALLRAKNKDFSIRGEASSTFADLQRGPLVLIGAFNNDGTIRLTEGMRFRFGLDEARKEWWITDRQGPNTKIGSLGWNGKVEMTQDYAIVARMFDSTTKQQVVIIAGLTPYGTKSAGDLITNPAFFTEFVKQAQPGWERKNLEVLISTSIIEGEAAPPKILATEYW
jgi:hypothetical protein